ncbi:MAG: hypothetical protein ACE5GD_03780 [Candidatus Geothermarchaeales archaeon]
MTADEEETLVEKIRDKSVKLFSSVLMGSATVLTMYMVPFMPQNPIFTVLMGLCVAIIGYRSPTSSAFIASCIMEISMLYQLAHAGFLTFLSKGGIVLVILLWMVCILFGSVSVDRHESLAAFSLGYLAFLTLFTEGWYLCIPLILLPSVLSRSFRTGLATIMFLLLYLPFQILAYAVNNLGDLAQISISEFAGMRPEVLASLNPPFDPTNEGVQTGLGSLKPFAEPLSKLTVDEFVNKLGLIPQGLSGMSENFFGMNLKVVGFSTYDVYRNVSVVYLNNVGSIVMLVLAIGLSTSMAYVTLTVLSRFRPEFKDPIRELTYGFFESVISGIVSMALFLGLFSGLADTLNYVSAFLQSSIQYTTMGFVIVLTAIPSTVKTVLDYGEMKIRLEGEFLTMLKQYADDILDLKAFLRRLKEIDKEMGTVALDNTLETLSARIGSLSTRVYRLDLKNLGEMRGLVDRVGEEVKEARDHVMNFTRDYIVKKIRLLRSTSLWTVEMGWLREDDEMVRALEKFDESESPAQSMDEIESLLEEIMKVADTLTHRLMDLHEETRVTLQNVFQVESRLIIDIERSIIKSIEVTLGEGKIWGALQMIRREIEDMEKTYSERVQALRSRLALAVERLKRDTGKLISSELKPLLGERFSNFMSVYDGISTIAREETGGVISVIGLRKVLDNVREQALTLTKTTYDLIKDLQDDVSEKSPMGFDKLVQMSNIPRSPHKPYGEVEKTLAMGLKPGEEMISDLERVLRRDLQGLLKLLRDYAVLHERVLNYSTAEAMILSILEGRKKVSMEDLPFAGEHSKWFMRLYAMQNYQDCELKRTDERYTLTRRGK